MAERKKKVIRKVTTIGDSIAIVIPRDFGFNAGDYVLIERGVEGLWVKKISLT
jgi:urease accessory protein UreE